MFQGQGNRGMAFEMLLNLVNAQYNTKGLALINKRPTPVKVLKSKGTQVIKGYFEEKSTVDYDGTYNGKSIAFEAKSVGEKRFDLKNIHKHQLEYLQKAEKHGAISFFLIEFRATKEVFLVSLNFIETYVMQSKKKGGRKSIPYDDFTVYGYLVERGRGVPVDYLSIVDKLNDQKVMIL
ncbi:Holliday junction resolvase RecU [Anaerobacillus sp. CMMVII]|uniref:Holliday junction resolvase RecU n=1 Tax=Anaerobacillus sp. CMMVII TaxID=2755588 RepID=UPI0021B7F511|nr:Holliday junction resolvase RecU [Anaerobacillus sp. CMMVII]MCT8138630.1 Holliday junction resolvase RecU [Anaerobacillus sp. CMMVII]